MPNMAMIWMRTILKDICETEETLGLMMLFVMIVMWK